MRRALCLFLLAAGLAHAGPRSRRGDDDALALPGLLVREGAWDRAAAALDAVDPEQDGLDLGRYWTLRGLVHLAARRPAEAALAFEAALGHATEGRELLELHLARARLATAEPELALAALDRAGEVGASLPASWLLRAQALELASRPDAALAALEAGAARFPTQVEFVRQQVFLLVRRGLFREARLRGAGLLAGEQTPEAAIDNAVALSEALRRGGDTREALTLLEGALLAHGDDRDLLVQAARAALDEGQPRAAARFLERAATLDPALALEAAEAYRRALDFDAALRLNAEVVDPVAKARQRLGLLVDAEQWDRAVALDERLTRLGLHRDDGVRYGLAYCHFRRGDFAEAERWLVDIADPAAFRRATELRQAIAACEASDGCW